jgi:hypothetical protein
MLQVKTYGRKQAEGVDNSTVAWPYLHEGAQFQKGDLLQLLQKIKEYAATSYPLFLASPSRKYALSAYTDEEVRTEFARMTGAQVEVVYSLADITPSSDACRLLLHCAIELANASVGKATSGPDIISIVPGTSQEEKTSSSLGKRVGFFSIEAL